MTQLIKHSRDLLRGRLSDAEVETLLTPVGFTDWRAARRGLLRLAGEAHTPQTLARVLPHLLSTLSGAANPDQVLVNLERFAHSATDKMATFDYLACNPRAVEILVTLFAGSQFLTEILLRNPEYFERLMGLRGLAQHKSVEELYAETRVVRSGADWQSAPQLDALRRFQRWELLRIGACDLLNLFDLPAVTAQLSNLADSLVRACLEIASEQAQMDADGFAVIAMGKLGGRELNYSSDIDLVFIAASDADSYRRLGERLIEGLTRTTAEGFLYRVDMRLRPWGRVSPLVTSLEGYVAYLEAHARQWEKQALLKARPIAGDRAAGEAFLRQVQPLVFDVEDTERARINAHAMKQRTEAALREQGRGWGEVKLGEGSIRDVEFVTQFLQLAHGARRPEIRSRNTLDALDRLAANELLSADDYRVLVDGYVFLRTIEHHLQMMHYRQTHALPDDEQALAHLAQRLGFGDTEAGERFVTRYEQHRAAIRDVYLRYLGGRKMKAPIQQRSTPSTDEVSRHAESLGQSYTEAFNREEIERHTALAQQLDADNLVEVDAVPAGDGNWRVTIVAYDYPGELALICGLLFAYGFSILDGTVFTYEPPPAPPHTRGGSETPIPPRAESKTPIPPPPAGRARGGQGHPKIVDTFTVRPVHGATTPETWLRYADDLANLLRMMQAGQRREARGELAKRVAVYLPVSEETAKTLYPVEIEIDNETSERYTALHIDAPDTIGFLYELTNALAYNRVYIARMMVSSVGDRVRDTLYVTDADGRKITDPDRQRELRAATVLIKHFTHLLPHSPDPESALLHFRGFIGQLFERPNWPDELASIERPEVIDALAHLLGVGEFLWDDFLRMQYANLFPVVQDVDALETAKSKEQLQADLEAVLHPVHTGPQPPSDGAPWRQALNAFKDREMFRIDMRHILGHTAEFWAFSEELTDLAEVVVNTAYHLCHEDLRSVHGSPLLESGELSDMAICALGKAGGRELGFASDIELMFIYAGNGQTSGPQRIPTSEFYERLVQTFIGAIYAKREGIFEIDLRLRPYGKAGSMAVSMEAFRRYFAPDGPAWAYERQALVKLRPIAGNGPLGREVMALRDAYVYGHPGGTGEPFDATAMRAMRERQVRHLVAGGTFNAKFSPGGLVDIEYLVQGLQITHGHDNPALRLTNIRRAMAALAEAGILSEDDFARLRKAHTFLRWLIDGLRMVRGNAKDLTVPPYDSEAFAFLARRLRYGNDTERLREELARYTSDVQALSSRLLG